MAESDIPGRYPELAREVRRTLNWYGDGDKISARLAARKTGVSHTTITAMLMGDRPKMNLLIDFAHAMNVDPNPLLRAAGFPEIDISSTVSVDPPYQKLLEWLPDFVLESLDLSDINLSQFQKFCARYYSPFHLRYVPNYEIKEMIDLFIDNHTDETYDYFGSTLSTLFSMCLELYRAQWVGGHHSLKWDIRRVQSAAILYSEVTALALYGKYKCHMRNISREEVLVILANFCEQWALHENGEPLGTEFITTERAHDYTGLAEYMNTISPSFVPLRLAIYQDNYNWFDVVKRSMTNMYQLAINDFSTLAYYYACAVFAVVELMKTESAELKISLPNHYIGMVHSIVSLMAYEGSGYDLHRY